MVITIITRKQGNRRTFVGFKEYETLPSNLSESTNGEVEKVLFDCEEEGITDRNHINQYRVFGSILKGGRVQDLILRIILEFKDLDYEMGALAPKND